MANPNDFVSAFDHAPIGTAITDPSGRLLNVNPALVRLLRRPAVDLIGTTLFDVTHPDDLEGAFAVCARLSDGPDPTSEHEVRLVRADGTAFPALVSAAKVLDADGTALHLVMHVQDVSQRHDAMAALWTTSMHDPLTGLPNRLLLMDRLETAVARHRRDASPLSVLFVDLDDFKAVNDTHGHGVGDAVLIAASRVMAAHVRPGDTVARVGGDEFVVVCEDTDASTAGGIARRLTSALDRPVDIAGLSLTASASIGAVSTDNETMVSPSDLLRDADQAMYRAKRSRRGQQVSR